MNRLLIFTIFWSGICVVNLLNAQDLQNKDYISSGYYQLIYEADIAYLEGNDSLAYVKLQEAEKTCPLLNQSIYNEMDLYSKLLLQNKDFGKAIYYMEKLATEYGAMPVQTFLALEKDSVFANSLLREYPLFKDSVLPAIIQKCNEFYTIIPKELIAELTEMTTADQKIREDSENYTAFHTTDTINSMRFFELVKKGGYPNMKQLGSNNFKLIHGIHTMVMHISDYYNIEEMILQYIRNGECEPDLYGIIIDRKIMMVRGERNQRSLYAAYENTEKEKIIDFAHLDDRRMAVGMPTMEMERKRNELIRPNE
jgi:hypothetical protein